jgi:hypothetical protein
LRRLANHTLLLLLVCFLLISLSAAQTLPDSDDSTPPAKESNQPTRQDQEKALKEQAVALLEQVVAESKSLTLPQNHVTVEQTALELLWKRDRTRAKALVADITGRILEMENRADSDQDSFRASTVYQLRMQMIQLLSGLDPRMALNFLQSTRPATGTRDSAERQLEYNLTTQVANNDPRMALELARKSLNDGISFQLANIYSSLNQTDPEAADQLAEDIVSKLRSEDLTANRQSWYFAMNFLGQVAPQGSGQSGRRARVVPSGASNEVTGSGGGQSNPQIAKQLTDIIVGAVQNPNMPQDMLRALQPYADVIAQYAPGKAPQIQRQLSQVQNTDPQMRSWEEFNKVNSQGSVEQSLAIAAQASPEVRPGMYQQVAWKAAGLGDYLRARQIVIDDISDPLQRTQMLREITKQAAFQAAGKGNFDLAHDLMQGFTPAEEHATVLAQIAHSAASQGQVKTARSILEEARGLLDSRPENATQLNALLQVAQAYAHVAPASGFQMVESLAGQLNELIAASALLDGFTPYARSFDSGEMLLHNAYVPDSLLRPFADALALLARSDFARAKAVADSLQPTEARVVTHMAIAKHILVD